VRNCLADQLLPPRELFSFPGPAEAGAYC